MYLLKQIGIVFVFQIKVFAFTTHACLGINPYLRRNVQIDFTDKIPIDSVLMIRTEPATKAYLKQA